MRVDFYGDILCPWCYIGWRRLARVVGEVPDLDVVWRSSELGQQNASPEGTALEMLETMWGAEAESRVQLIRALGAAEGLELNLDRARPARSFDAHRVIHLAAEHGRGDSVVERLLHGYHTEGQDIADHGTLVALGTDAGLPAAAVEAMLAGDEYGDAVGADDRRSGELGVGSVPTLVLDDARLVSGLHEPAALQRQLARHG